MDILLFSNFVLVSVVSCSAPKSVFLVFLLLSLFPFLFPDMTEIHNLGAPDRVQSRVGENKPAACESLLRSWL